MVSFVALRAEPAGCDEVLGQRLSEIPGLEVRRREPLRRYTSLRLGGVADWLVIPSSLEQLAAVLRTTWALGCPVTVLGGGSNLLIADTGLRGVVIRIGRSLGRLVWDGPRLWAQAGASLPAVARQAAMRRLSGLEFAAGIPGTLGGAIVMNAGAHQGDMAAVVTRVQAVHRSGRLVEFSREACRFRYRGSRFLDEPEWIVAAAELLLRPDDPDRIAQRMQDYLKRRRDSQPLGTYNAGSIFKNPPGDYAGRLIEQAGCKGWREGGAEVSTLHANFIVHHGDATASDVWRLIQRVRREVEKKFGVRLELEVGVLGFSEETGIEV